MTETKHLNYTKKNVEFHNFEYISFPSICIVCGKETKSKIKRTYYGRIYDSQDIKRNNFLTLPICSKCQGTLVKDRNDERKSKNKVTGFSVLGTALAITNYFLTYSIIFSIIIFAIFFLIPYSDFHGKFKTSHKIELENYVKIDIMNYGKSVKLHFKNQDYARCVNDLNSDTAAPYLSEKVDSTKAKKVKTLTHILEKSKKPELKDEEKDIFSDDPFKKIDQKPCMGCGALNDDDSVFCVKCGNKLT
jgi:ribosomal protein L40E